MLNRLLLLLCLTGHVFTKEPPDVDCFVVHLQYVHCSWDKQGTPEVNYIFYSGFSNVDTIRECATYLSENSTNTGCNQTYGDVLNRFQIYYTKLVHGKNSYMKEHQLKNKVKLNPPTQLTVQMESDSNLWFYWNQITRACVKSEVRFRTNSKKWETSKVSIGEQKYCINLPSSSSLYELQVRSKIDNNCGESIFWSDWSQPVAWGFNNSTDTNQMNGSMSLWTAVMTVVGVFTLVLMVMMLLHHERFRIIPMVPKPSLIIHEEDWLRLSKGLKESFKTNYNERACPVSEYCHVSLSDSESSGGSTFSVTTDQTDCSVSILADKSDPSTPCSSSASTVVVLSEETEQVFV